MPTQPQRALAFMVGALALAVVGAVALPRILGLAAGPEAEMISQLAKTEEDGMSLAIQGSPTPLVARHHHFDRITVHVDPVAQTAEASSTLDFTGALGSTVVSSLGVERTSFHLEKGRWVADHGWAPRLAAAVAALEARRRAWAGGNAEALVALGENPAAEPTELVWDRARRLSDRDFRVKAWYVRTDREDAVVTEEYRLTGSLPDRPVDEEGTWQLLLERHGREFLFSQGLR